MSSEEPVGHGVTEKEGAPLRVPTPSTNTMIAATTTTRKAAATHTSFFSPQKRKRDTSPPEIPETPWRLQQSISHDDDDNDDNEKVNVELTAEDEVVASGQVSPRSNKLASQLSDLNLTGELAGPCLLPRNLEITMTLEEEPPAAKKVKRRGRPPNVKKKATITTGGNGGRSDEDLAVVPRQMGKGALSFGGENANGNGKEAVNGETRRRLRSPPLPQMDSDTSVNYSVAAAVDESDGDVDSDDPDQLGIGYKPTLMQRHARDRKRMQQIKEYKARVSREAREKRSEMRRSRRSFPARYVTPAVGGAHSAGEGEKRKMVHFNLQPVVLEPVVVGPMPEGSEVAPEVSTIPY